MRGIGRNATGLMWIEKKCGLLWVLIWEYIRIISNYWSRDSLLGISILKRCMSLGKFGPIFML